MTFFRSLAFGLVILSVACANSSAAPSDGPSRPNVVVILADDLGYGDLQCYNPERGRIATPHLDRLASRGMRFTDAHSSSGVCSPSRYTLLTGRYHWRTRLQSGIVGYLEGPLIAADRLTLAGLLHQQGYDTACIGKWHLGWNWQIPPEQRGLFAPPRGKVPTITDRHREAWQTVYSLAIEDGPTTRGFETYFGTDVPNWPPYCFIEDDRTRGSPSTFLPPELLRNHLASLPGPALPDWKLEGVLPALADRACDYIQQRAASDDPFFLYLPLTSPHTPLAVNPAWQGRSGLDSPVADLIMETDAAVGQVLAALQDNGMAENTLVLFTSDNGFAPYVGAAHLEEQGHFPSGPLRGYKGDAWEGGHRVPFLVAWPGIIEAGSECDQLVHHADVMATLAELVDVSLPENAGEDSVSICPLLRGSHSPLREHAVSQGAKGLFSIRRGPWKMLFGPGGGGDWSKLSAGEPDGQPAQLYDLAADLGETQNRYADEPALAEELTVLMGEIVQRGRSTPGPSQSNDVPVRWKRHMQAEPAAK